MPSGADVFSVPIFFVVFREVIEAAIIISVLLGFVDGLVLRSVKADEDEQKHRKRLVKRMRWQVRALTVVAGSSSERQPRHSADTDSAPLFRRDRFGLARSSAWALRCASAPPSSPS